MRRMGSTKSLPSETVDRPLKRVDTCILLVLLALGALCWLWFELKTRITLEDAYITFRYAKNLAEGSGFVFNIGERVLGTTTPLQTLLLGLLGWLLGPNNIPLISAVVMPIFGLAAGVFAYLALIKLGASRPGTALAVLFFFFHPLVIRTSLGGMETPLVLFLMALSLYFLSRQNAIAATAAVALLALCRIDGLIWGGVLLALTLTRPYRKPVKQILVFAVIVAPWLIFAFLYFGSPIPNTLIAKGVIRPGREMIFFDPIHFERYVHWFASSTGFAQKDPLIPVWLALIILGAVRVFRSRRPELMLTAVYPVVYMFGMYFGRAPKYQWYLLPMSFCFMLLAGLGVGQLISWAVASGPARWKRTLSAAATGIIVISWLNYTADLVPRTARHARLFQENEDSLRRGVGLWFRNSTPHASSVAMEAIGYQGYFSNRRTIDMAGLITPKVVRFKASTGSNGVLFELIRNYLKPDYIVLRSFEVDTNKHFNGGKLFENEMARKEFFRTYNEAKRFEAKHPKMAPLVTHLTVYQRIAN